MSAKKRGLGRGLNALLSGSGPSQAQLNQASRTSTAPPTPSSPDQLSPDRLSPVPSSPIPSSAAIQRPVQNIPIEQITHNPLQPRERLDPVALEELANSIRVQGILQPILVRPDGLKHQILVGERRWRAAQLAGLKTVPAIVHDVDDCTAQEWALLENLQREDLNPIEEARAYQTLIAEHGLTQGEVAKRVGKDRASVANTVRLLNLSQSYIDDLLEGALTAGHARVLLSVEGAAQRQRLRDRIVENGLSVREAEKSARLLQAGGANQKKKARRLRAGESVIDANLQHFRDLLEEKLKTRVTLKPQSKTAGQAIIHYTSLADLDRLLDALGINEDAQR